MIKVCVPATSANCCVGFDCMGIALDWWSTFTFDVAHTTWVSGCDPQFGTPDNLVLQAFYHTCEILDVKKPAVHLHIETDIPFSHGFGSSATCIVAGIMGANAWFHKNLTKNDVLKIATDIERHPDNVAPAIFGAATVSIMVDGIPHMTYIPTADWQILAIVPEETISTKAARKVLPSSISFDHAKQQVAHALVFEQALQTGDENALFLSCVDYLHEPYRKALIPEYEGIHTYCQAHALSMWISGSGSSMLVISKDKKKLDDLADTLDVPWHHVQISQKGAYVEYE
ncbi:homoserine kinase [Absicoccus porci]|nr:homoserine kinase [Absicoccus porci]